MIRITKTFNILLIVLLFVATGLVQAQSVMEQLRTNKQTSAFAEALEAVNLDQRIEQAGPFTIFAPSNESFNKLTSAQQSNRNLLLNHIFTGMATERSLKVMSDITCLSGRSVEITEENNLNVDGKTIVESNMKAKNGVIHIIDGVIE